MSLNKYTMIIVKNKLNLPQIKRHGVNIEHLLKSKISSSIIKLQFKGGCIFHFLCSSLKLVVD